MVVVVFLVVCGRDGNGCGGNGRCGTCTGPCGGTLGVMVVMVLVVGVVVGPWWWSLKRLECQLLAIQLTVNS